jgi:hypothetical protein
VTDPNVDPQTGITWSPDHRWWWDGHQWQPAQAARTNAGANGLFIGGIVVLALACLSVFTSLNVATGPTCIGSCAYGAFAVPVILAVVGAALLFVGRRRRGR